MNKICGKGNWKKKYFCPYKSSINLFIMNDDSNIKYFAGKLIERLHVQINC